jgi:hypothetical protein
MAVMSKEPLPPELGAALLVLLPSPAELRFIVRTG